jgi:hypothetical protein
MSSPDPVLSRARIECRVRYENDYPMVITPGRSTFHLIFSEAKHFEYSATVAVEDNTDQLFIEASSTCSILDLYADFGLVGIFRQVGNENPASEVEAVAA